MHLDTNLLHDIVAARPAQVRTSRGCLVEGRVLTASAVALSGFLNGTHSHGQKSAVRHVLAGGTRPFDHAPAERASRLFHQTGRRRGSHKDCMIAAAALSSRKGVAARNTLDFSKPRSSRPQA